MITQILYINYLLTVDFIKSVFLLNKLPIELTDPCRIDHLISQSPNIVKISIQKEICDEFESIVNNSYEKCNKNCTSLSEKPETTEININPYENSNYGKSYSSLY